MRLAKNIIIVIFSALFLLTTNLCKAENVAPQVNIEGFSFSDNSLTPLPNPTNVPPKPTANDSNSTVPGALSNKEILTILNSVNTSDWTLLGNSIKWCIPNTYTVPNPVLLLVFKEKIKISEQTGKSFEPYTKDELLKLINDSKLIYKVVGWTDENKCNINIFPTNNSDQPAVMCNFLQKDLTAVSEASQQMTDVVVFPPVQQQASQAMQSACTYTGRKL